MNSRMKQLDTVGCGPGTLAALLVTLEYPFHASGINDRQLAHVSTVICWMPTKSPVSRSCSTYAVYVRVMGVVPAVFFLKIF